MTNPLRKANDNSRTGGLPSFTTAIVSVAVGVAEKTAGSACGPSGRNLYPRRLWPRSSSTTATSEEPGQIRRPWLEEVKDSSNPDTIAAISDMPEPAVTNVNYSEFTYQFTIEFLNRPIKEFTVEDLHYLKVIYLDPRFKTQFTDVNERAQVIFYTLKLIPEYLRKIEDEKIVLSRIVLSRYDRDKCLLEIEQEKKFIHTLADSYSKTLPQEEESLWNSLQQLFENRPNDLLWYTDLRQRYPQLKKMGSEMEKIYRNLKLEGNTNR